MNWGPSSGPVPNVGNDIRLEPSRLRIFWQNPIAVSLGTLENSPPVYWWMPDGTLRRFVFNSEDAHPCTTPPLS